jgi:mannan endo-1,4-beta-mannosidase
MLTGSLPTRCCLAFGSIAAVCLAAAASAEGHRPGFVYAEGARLKLNGGDFYFSGANSFSMLYSEADAEAELEVASELGLNAVRLWGFWDGEDLEPDRDGEGNIVQPPTPDTDRHGRYVLQARPGVYPEPAWKRLDYVIYRARVHDIKLIIPLVNQWPEFGGIDQYLVWAGLSHPKPAAADGHYAVESELKKERYKFWHSPEAKALYFDYVEHLLNRVNTYTNIAYKDDPTIMIWEIVNEARYGMWEGDTDATAVRDFLAEAAGVIKSIDPNHLVGTGEEGFLRQRDLYLDRYAYPWNAAEGEGTDFVLNAAIPGIDVLGFHCWPFQWGLWDASSKDYGYDRLGEYPDIAAFPPEWIAEHARLAERFGKPLYLGEFGLQILRAPGSDIEERDRIMRAVYDAVEAADLAGAAFWHITASHDPENAAYRGPMERRTLLQAQYYDAVRPHDVDFRFDVFCPEDVTTCGIIEDFTTLTVSKVERPDPPDDSPFHPPCIPPWAVCGDQCVLLASHPDHCGACGKRCPDTSSCEDGSCAPLSYRYGRDEALQNPGDGGGCGVSRVAGKPGGALVILRALM